MRTGQPGGRGSLSSYNRYLGEGLEGEADTTLMTFPTPDTKPHPSHIRSPQCWPLQPLDWLSPGYAIHNVNRNSSGRTSAHRHALLVAKMTLFNR